MAAMRTLIFIAAALLLGACGADEPSSKADLQDGALKFAQCMREQGLDFPDPKVDEDGGIQIGGPNVGDRNPAKMEKAHKACQKHLEDVDRPRPSAEERAKMKEQ